MRALKTLLIILAAVLVIFLILGLIGPKHSHVERSTVIKAPVAVVWSHASSLKKNNEWSPFLEMDPTAKVTYEGEDGAVGSKSRWEGGSSGKGSQEITAIEAEKHMGIKLLFEGMMGGEANADLNYEALGDSTKATWSFDSENGFMGRAFCVFMDMDKMIGGEFAKGLAKLKTLSEDDAAKMTAQPKTYRGFTIETVERPEMVYVGKREVVKWDKMGAFFGKNYPAQGKALGEAKLEMAGAPSGVYFKWDEPNKQADVMAAMPVKAGADTKVKGWETFVVPAGKALLIPYHGAYDKSMEAHLAMDEMMKANNLALRDVVIEEYVTDPMAEKDTTKWLTNIYYMVK